MQLFEFILKRLSFKTVFFLGTYQQEKEYNDEKSIDFRSGQKMLEVAYQMTPMETMDQTPESGVKRGSLLASYCSIKYNRLCIGQTRRIPYVK